ncbi:MAG TPA: Gfo/Idh/MocA family oxidoreductase [Planctomycetota bacterium]|nr:Gfo/Idh/MocA family oxidoreductase [Planctomycetota bacterium]
MKGLTRGPSRREFLRATAAVGAPYFLASTALGAEGRAAASERITMGGIGMGGRGSGDLRGFSNFPQVQVLAVCDVVKAKRDNMKAAMDQKYGNKDCASVNDFREIIARPDIDTVMIGTPDHWHAIIACEAMKAGKDVFCEKPETLTIREGRIMVETARRYARVFSGGSQRVLGDYGALARYIRSGAIGEVKEAFVSVGGPSRDCDLAPEPVPPGLDWDLWLGPAPWAPYNRGRLGFRAWKDYSGGGMTDWGAHKFGAVVFAMDLQETGPVEILPPDGKDVKLLTYVYASGFRLYHGGGGDITYKGTEGEASRRQMGQPIRPVEMLTYKGNGGLAGDFLHCVVTRERPFRDIEFAHRGVSVCHLGNLAYWLGRPLKWDPVKEDFVGDPDASRWVDRPKREPWTL